MAARNRRTPPAIPTLTAPGPSSEQARKNVNVAAVKSATVPRVGVVRSVSPWPPAAPQPSSTSDTLAPVCCSRERILPRSPVVITKAASAVPVARSAAALDAAAVRSSAAPGDEQRHQRARACQIDSELLGLAAGIFTRSAVLSDCDRKWLKKPKGHGHAVQPPKGSEIARGTGKLASPKLKPVSIPVVPAKKPPLSPTTSSSRLSTSSSHAATKSYTTSASDDSGTSSISSKGQSIVPKKEKSVSTESESAPERHAPSSSCSAKPPRRRPPPPPPVSLSTAASLLTGSSATATPAPALGMGSNIRKQRSASSVKELSRPSFHSQNVGNPTKRPTSALITRPAPVRYDAPTFSPPALPPDPDTTTKQNMLRNIKKGIRKLAQMKTVMSVPDRSMLLAVIHEADAPASCASGVRLQRPSSPPVRPGFEDHDYVETENFLGTSVKGSSNEYEDLDTPQRREEVSYTALLPNRQENTYSSLLTKTNTGDDDTTEVDHSSWQTYQSETKTIELKQQLAMEGYQILFPKRKGATVTGNNDEICPTTFGSDTPQTARVTKTTGLTSDISAKTTLVSNDNRTFKKTTPPSSGSQTRTTSLSNNKTTPLTTPLSSRDIQTNTTPLGIDTGRTKTTPSCRGILKKTTVTPFMSGNTKATPPGMVATTAIPKTKITAKKTKTADDLVSRYLSATTAGTDNTLAVKRANVMGSRRSVSPVPKPATASPFTSTAGKRVLERADFLASNKWQQRQT